MPKQANLSFSALALSVGSKVQLVLDAASGRNLLSSTLLGYLENQFVLIKLPVAEGDVPVSFLEGEALVVRIFTGISVCMFNATVLRRELHPFYCLHLSYPQTVKNVRLRNSIRIQTDLACTVKGEDFDHQATMINLSTSGALIRSTHADIAAEAPVKIGFALTSQFDTGSADLQLDAVVRSLRGANSGAAAASIGDGGAPLGEMLYGVQFVDVDPTDQMALQNYAYEVLLSDRRRIL